MATVVRRQSDMTADIVKFRGVGISFPAPANSTTTNDYKFTEARLVDGIQFIIEGATAGDSVSVEVVDKDNILGYGSNVVLDTFATNWYIAADSQNQGAFQLPYSAEIAVNLYFRIKYTNTNLVTSTTVRYNLYAHKYMA